MSSLFNIHVNYEPQGDQPSAIDKLSKNIITGEKEQTLLGVTGSGKTFTIANVIEKVNLPTLVIAHNKTLAAQLFEEFRGIFPNNAVHYFVSYYDYYQPEAYVPSTKTYIAKDSKINDQIDQLRHASTSALFNRRDVIIVSSVSCIFGIGSPKDYFEMITKLNIGMKLSRDELLKKLTEVRYSRSRAELKRGNFRAIGNYVDIMPSNVEDRAVKIKFDGDSVSKIYEVDSYTSEVTREVESIILFPGSHYVVEKLTTEKAIKSIKKELQEQKQFFKRERKLEEMKRLEERTIRDLELMIFE